MTRKLEFVVYEGSREVTRRAWTGRRLVIGRHPDADIRVQEPTMSARHAEILATAAGISIRDLSSLNGTLLNGVRVTESVLRPGDEVEIGLARIRVGMPDTLSDRLSDPSLEDSLPPTQTVKIQLDQLRQDRGAELEEDERLLHLRDLFEALKLVDDADDVLRNTRQVLRQTFRHARVFILRPTAKGIWNDADNLEHERRPSLTFANEAARTHSAILSTSLPEDQRFSAATSVRISGIETAIAAPVSCDGQPVAVLYVDRLGLPPFDRRDLNLLGIAANHVSAVLEGVSRFNELRSKNEELLAAREREAELNRTLERRVEQRTAEIRRQNEEIQHLAEAKDELLGIAAHDIRGPLTVIQGTTELILLRLEALDEATLKRSLEMVHSASRGLGQLLGELLDAKSIEAGTLNLRKEPTTVRSLIDKTLPVAQLAANDKRIRLEVRCDADLTLEADAQRLSQAITNLLLNAVKFSKAGSRIVLEGRLGIRGRIEISVQDEGVGIPEADIKRIFGTFEQGEAGKQFGGSGLGLMIARRLVELHNGTLSVNSKVGVGTRFVLSLPVKGEGPPRRQAAPWPTAPPSVPPSPEPPEADDYEDEPIGF